MKRTSATGSSSGQYVDRNPATSTPGTSVIAEDRNNVQEEICNTIEDLGLTLDGADQTQLKRAVIGWSHQVGELLMMETDDAPGIFFPAVRRSADIDISSANYPLLVTKLRAAKTTVDGVTNFTGTVAGSVITFAYSVPVAKMLGLLKAEALVAGFLNQNQPADFTEDFTTAATRKCINIGGVDYPIAGVNLATYAVTVVGSPATGSQTANFYPYRIAGSATTARLARLSGFVPVATGDYDDRNVAGWRAMDRGQGHGHNVPIYNSGTTGVNIASTNSPTFATNALAGGETSDGSNGSPRTGKTFEPKSVSQNFYTWAGIYNA